MSFPTIVYRCPGPHYGPSGKTYESKGIVDGAALADALADGWYETMPEAVAGPGPLLVEVLEGNEVSAATALESLSDDDAPTRAELEQQAASLGVRFDGRTGDSLLAERIAKAMA